MLLKNDAAPVTLKFTWLTTHTSSAVIESKKQKHFYALQAF
jgi:hypothetical protein